MLIESKMLLSILTKIAEQHPYRVHGDSETYSSYNEGWVDAIDRMEGCVREMELNAVLKKEGNLKHDRGFVRLVK